MADKIKLITTVGISLFLNYMEREVRSRYGRDYQSIDVDIQTLKQEELVASEIYNKTKYGHRIKNIREFIEDYWFEKNGGPNYNASAEISSINKISKSNPESEIFVHLLSTDTLTSTLAAELIVDFFEEFGNKYFPQIKEVVFQRVQPVFEDQKDSTYTVKDLRISVQKDYEKGLLNLIEVLEKITEKKNIEKTIINITGGYKAIIPIATLYAQLKGIRLNYLFNEEGTISTNDLIEIHNLPFNLDWQVIEAAKPFLDIDNHPIWNTANKEIAELLLLESENLRANIQAINSRKNDPTSSVIRYLIHYKLIQFNHHSKSVSTSIIGELIKQIKDFQNDRGLLIEYLLFEFFSRKNKQAPTQIDGFKSQSNIVLNGVFRKDGSIPYQPGVPSSDNQKDWSTIGDIDLYLKNIAGEPALCEIKALATFKSYKNENKFTKYLKQYHARLLAFAEQKSEEINRKAPNLRFIFIIYQWQFEGFETSIKEDSDLKTVAEGYQNSITELSISLPDGTTFNPTVSVWGLKSIVRSMNKKGSIKANYYSFYQKPHFKWEIIL